MSIVPGRSPSPTAFCYKSLSRVPTGSRFISSGADTFRSRRHQLPEGTSIDEKMIEVIEDSVGISNGFARAILTTDLLVLGIAITVLIIALSTVPERFRSKDFWDTYQQEEQQVLKPEVEKEDSVAQKANVDGDGALLRNKKERRRRRRRTWIPDGNASAPMPTLLFLKFLPIWAKAVLSIGIDIIGISPVVLFPFGQGELVDILWRPIAVILIQGMYGSTAISVAYTLLEEYFPFTDIFPTATITLIFYICFGKTPLGLALNLPRLIDRGSSLTYQATSLLFFLSPW